MIEVKKKTETTPDTRAAAEVESVFQVKDLSVLYGDTPAIQDVTMDIRPRRITALIGPSGCGKSTLVRCFNRMNDLIPGAAVEGEILYHGQDLYGPGIDPVQVRKLI